MDQEDDWTITFPNTSKILSTNKYLLASQSSEFKKKIGIAEFYNERSIMLKEPIPLVEKALRFMKGLAINDDMRDYISLFLFGYKYKIEYMKDKFRQHIIQNLNFENVCTVYDIFAQMNPINVGDILYRCWRIFDNDWEDVCNSDDFFNCAEPTILMYLNRRIYKTLRDESLFHIIVSKTLNDFYNDDFNTSEYSEKLADYLNFIRFLSIPLEILERDIFPLGLLHPKEVDAIKYAAITGDFENLPPDVCRNPNKRMILPTYHYLLEHLNKIGYTCLYSKMIKIDDCFVINFKVKGPCFFRSFELPIDYMLNYTIKIYIYITVNDSRYNMKIEESIICKYNAINLKPPLFLHENSIVSGYVQIINMPVVTNMIIRPGTFLVIPNDLSILKTCNNWRKFLVEKILLYF